jgi:hypothetical protein
MPEIQIKDALNKAFIKVRPERASIDKFKKNFIRMQDDIKNNSEESEEFLKNTVSDFLKNTWYGEDYYINTKKRVDLVIHTGKDTKTPVGVIIEAKSPKNKLEMISKENFNTKAMQELLLYYFRETIDCKNGDLKHLIITNTIEWFIFDARLFYRIFSQDKKLMELYISFKDGTLLDKKTDYFYSEIASPFIEKHKKELAYVHLNISNYENIIRDNDNEADNKLISLYKLFSPEHLLKLPFLNDSNILNQSFYNELLYIMGLSEETVNNMKIIVRRKQEDRKKGSLMENAIFQLSVFSLTEEEKFETALELIIIWINRILFLKLLESQQIIYQKGNPDYKFLNIDKVKDYNDLNTLFFFILAKEPKERDEGVKNKFKNVPYLNSSLFDLTDTEKSYLRIASLKDENIDIFPSTVLKDRSGNKQKGSINALNYIFEFLDAYDFSSEGSEQIQEENKTLINASVLGLIFEKINGYKEGSYFTPGFITTFICRETIRNVVVNKFNEIKNWKVGSFDELKNYIENKSIDNIKEANDIINSITICDPAVGSGHFLVSALNEIIAIKSYFGILADNNGIKLKNCIAEVVNDELMIFDDDGNSYVYNSKNAESRRIQETIFQEKKRIIEGSLFGVDINPNSVKICRLRLWIELLKNAYYTEVSGYNELETLPNIDINIKCGNSLISRFELDIDLKEELSKLKYTVNDYQEAVYKYKNAVAKNEKEKLDNLIKEIKDNFRGGVQKNTILSIKKGKLHDELDAIISPGELFGLSSEEKARKEKRINEIEKKLKEINRQIEEIENNNIYENTFEWRFEFPEIIDNNGDFTGFDAVIGNPPYVSTKGVSVEEKKVYLIHYGFSDDTYNHFFFRGFKLLNNNGILSFISPKTFWTIQTKNNLRDLILSKKVLYIFDTANPFKEAMVDTCITSFQNCDINDNKFVFFDGSININEPKSYIVEQSTYLNTQNSVIFKPTPENLKIQEMYGQKVKELYDKWWEKISTSKNIEKNKNELEEYRRNLKPGDIALLGCLTEGGQGLATANNGKYIAVRKSSKWAKNVYESRPKKLDDAIRIHKIKIPELKKFTNTAEYLKSLSEKEIALLFDNLKEKYGRDIFGQGYLYKLVEDNEVADVEKLTADEKANGISTSKKYYVPYDKGDKDGNRWYLDTPHAIAWSKENVQFLKTDQNARYQGYMYFFREGFCWTNVLNPQARLLKAKLKKKTVNDVGSMSLFSIIDSLPNYYFVTLINSELLFDYYREFINCSVNIQINDIRQLPIMIPTKEQLEICNNLFLNAFEVKKDVFGSIISESDAEEKLIKIEQKIEDFVEKLYNFV